MHNVVRLPRAAAWPCAIFLAVAFVFVGMSKLEGSSAMRWTERFVNWGYPANAQYVIGVLEILAGLGVLIPNWRRTAAAMLVGLMIGALCTHAVHAEFTRLIPPFVLGGLAFLLYSARPPNGAESPQHRKS
jgi:putative oxidoreductase